MRRRAINRTVRNVRRAATAQRLAAMQENQRTILLELVDSVDDLSRVLDGEEAGEATSDEVATRTNRLERTLREYRAKTHDDPKPR